MPVLAGQVLPRPRGRRGGEGARNQPQEDQQSDSAFGGTNTAYRYSQRFCGVYVIFTQPVTKHLCFTDETFDAFENWMGAVLLGVDLNREGIFG